MSGRVLLVVLVVMLVLLLVLLLVLVLGSTKLGLGARVLQGPCERREGAAIARHAVGQARRLLMLLLLSLLAS